MRRRLVRSPSAGRNLAPSTRWIAERPVIVQVGEARPARPGIGPVNSFVVEDQRSSRLVRSPNCRPGAPPPNWLDTRFNA